MREKTTTAFEAMDGQVFSTAPACEEYERDLAERRADAYLDTVERGTKWKRLVRPHLLAFARRLLG